MRKPTGHALLIVLFVLAGLGATAAAVTLRIESDLAARPAEGRRLQALWLARSGAARASAFNSEVPTPEGPALVWVEARPTAEGLEVVSQAAMGGGTARVEAVLGPDRRPLRWKESYEATAASRIASGTE